MAGVGDDLQLCIKNPGRNVDFKLRCPVNATLDDLQQLLQQQYDGHPEPSAQTVRSGSSQGVVVARGGTSACCRWRFFQRRAPRALPH
jgi:hypothetical protein